MNETIALDSIQAIAASFGASFVADKIVDTVLEKDGIRYYKVRWVKYSWEPVESFSHMEHLINDFWKFHVENDKKASPVGDIQQTVKNSECTSASALKQLVSECTAMQTITLCTLDGLQQSNDVIISTDGKVSTLVNNDLAIRTSNNVPILSNYQISNRNDLPQMDIIPPSIESLETHVSDSHPEMHQELAMDLPQVPSHLAVNGEKQTNNSRKERDVKSTNKSKQPAQCTICGIIFTSSKNLSAHKKLHVEERKFSCTKCDRRFRRKLHLQRHLNSHNGIKAFSCQTCGSSFSSKWYMEAHAMVHSGVKPFECDTCKKRFNNKANLSKHIKIHIGLKPFVCNLCGRSYRTGYDMNRHKQTHGKIDQQCHICGRTYKGLASLNKHKATKHPDNENDETSHITDNDISDTDTVISNENSENEKSTEIAFRNKSLTIVDPFESLNGTNNFHPANPEKAMCRINENLISESLNMVSENSDALVHEKSIMPDNLLTGSSDTFVYNKDIIPASMKVVSGNSIHNNTMIPDNLKIVPESSDTLVHSCVETIDLADATRRFVSATSMNENNASMNKTEATLSPSLSFPDM